ncbi:MAG TPA: alpha amylase C-terminal domain-containing protein, partial [Gemmatimonadaceae bacterium]|nr:alpha amylase C-terminal domain-containing protein [Gemmatimonadaceae bacterium]
HLRDDPMRASFLAFVQDLGRLYREHPSFWRDDYDPRGFQWIDVADAANSVVSYVRRDGDEHVVVVLNMTPIPREQYRIGAPSAGPYVELLSSDANAYGGSSVETPKRIETDALPLHGFEQSMALVLPPLGALVLAPAPRGG